MVLLRGGSELSEIEQQFFIPPFYDEPFPVQDNPPKRFEPVQCILTPGMWFLVLDLFSDGFCTLQQFTLEGNVMAEYKMVVHQDSLIYMSQLLDDRGWYRMFENEMNIDRQPIIVKDYFYEHAAPGHGGRIGMNP